MLICLVMYVYKIIIWAFYTLILRLKTNQNNDVNMNQSLEHIHFLFMSGCWSWTFQLRFKEIKTQCQTRQAQDVFPKKYTDVWQKRFKGTDTKKTWDQAWSLQQWNRANQTILLLLKPSLYSIFPQVALFFVNLINSSDELHRTWILFILMLK